MTDEPYRAQVCIVGAGPVGLVLAIDLAARGVSVIVAEKRPRGLPPSVKSNHVAARTMEIFRRLGIAAAVRDAGLPADYPNDVAYRTTFTGLELSRIPIPCRADRYTATGGPDTWWPTPEPPHRINQIFLEPVLLAHALTLPGLMLLDSVEADEITQHASGVVARAKCLATGRRLDIMADYLVGCDGGRSVVRNTIRARLEGDASVQRVQSTYFRAPDLIRRQSGARAWGTFSLNPRRCGNTYAIDGRETWLMHNYLNPGEDDFDSVDRDHCLRTILGVGDDFEYRILNKEDWVGRRLVANRFRDRRVFICGDAAHLWVPMAGYGMNAGIADAANLSWLLAAHLQGWAPESILDAYEAERLPITEQVSRFAMNHALALARQRQAVPATIEDGGPDGAAARARVGQAAYDLNVAQYCCGGLNFGYFYDRSPIIAYDEQTPPAYTMDRFAQSTVPGCRTPHLWLGEGRSLYDALGSGFTLLRLDAGVEIEGMLAAAAKRGVPLELLDIDRADAVYDRKLVLSRPDGHVAWRGDSEPADALDVIDRIRGAAPRQANRAA